MSEEKLLVYSCNSHILSGEPFKLLFLTIFFCVLKEISELMKKEVFRAGSNFTCRYRSKYIDGDAIKKHFAATTKVCSVNTMMGSLNTVNVESHYIMESDFIMSLLSPNGT